MQEQKWEYQVTLETPKMWGTEAALNEHMNKTHAEGWELVGTPVLDAARFWFFWKRPV